MRTNKTETTSTEQVSGHSTWDERPKPSRPVPVAWGYSRGIEIIPVAATAEERLANRLGWDLSVIRGREAATESGGSGAYRVLSPNEIGRDGEPVFGLLRLSKWRRFGNSVRQIRNVFYVAERYGVPLIEFPGPHRFFGQSTADGIQTTWGGPSQSGPRMSGLEGDFYYLVGLGLYPTAEEQARMMTRYVRPLLKGPLRRDHPEMRDDDLVLHFRAGDVFNTSPGKPVHRSFGQPPLSVYLSAVERERPARVWIVYEDRSNPTVDAAARALGAKGVEVRMQSADLASDLHVLLNARCLVGGIGSFSSAVAALSSKIRKVYQFFPPIEALRHLGIDVVVCSDLVGDYHRAIRSNNWSALPEQLALMLTYPMTAIGFQEYPALAQASALGTSDTTNHRVAAH